MPDEVTTEYTLVDGCQIAYQVHGSGSIDLLFLAPGLFGCCELEWDDPYARVLQRFGRFSRVVRFDRRGSGMSDRAPLGTAPGLDEWARDAAGVLDAVGIDRCAVYGNGMASPIAIRFAARFPERVDALVLGNAFARLRSAPDHPFGVSDEVVEAGLEVVRSGWGRGVLPALYGAPHDDASRARSGRHERLSASPAAALALMATLADVDARADLAQITAPTLVVYQPNPVLNIEQSRSVAAAISGAIFEEEREGDYVWRSETDDEPQWLSRIAEFLTGVRHDADPDRVFATVLVTDIVGSTATAAALGDRRWRLLIDAHDAATRRQIQRSGGRIITLTGDGAVAIFSTPSPALGCAIALREALAERDIVIRVGLHAAEIELRGDNVGGIGVHIAARISALAGGGDILVSNTVRDLVTGSVLTFVDRGRHTLKGVPGEWNVSALATV